MSHGRGHSGMHGSHGPWGGWTGMPSGGWGRSGRPGPPPWVAGLLGLDQGGEPPKGPRVRRGDVRMAILDVLRDAAERDEPVNGYQVIQQITDRSDGAWRPSPGSVYPTIQQLQDEGLVEAEDDRGRRTLALTAAGADYVAANADQLAGVWAPFETEEKRRRPGGEYAELKPEIGQMMSAVWQIVTAGSDGQRRAAIEVLVDTRRRLYGILADGEPVSTGDQDEGDDGDESGEDAEVDLGGTGS